MRWVLLSIRIRSLRQWHSRITHIHHGFPLRNTHWLLSCFLRFLHRTHRCDLRRLIDWSSTTTSCLRWSNNNMIFSCCTFISIRISSRFTRLLLLSMHTALSLWLLLNWLEWIVNRSENLEILVCETRFEFSLFLQKIPSRFRENLVENGNWHWQHIRVRIHGCWDEFRSWFE